MYFYMYSRRKNDLAEVSKNSAKFENNFIEPLK